ncbi:MAG: VCBS repeat-containing protein, partial [Gemmatimonadetes bacterium]|nr:VCBS repeat-containing protein [Gemmatimonadota bacterium]NIQ58971.1 VCBS repeat-containing protein [Gemmatimonadota bacterium]NIX47858.1 VCBS repeat-containing protein [Gemmatimonadota bacterium]NIY12229.1 VCBS repeat-containing protein [Gemmatimonadota bacterium]
MAVAALSACTAAAPSAGPAAGAAEGGWERLVAPFPVLDASGASYGHPFLGGFDVPRPQLVDIDADGDADLFIQERSNALIFLENTGTPTAAEHVWRTDRFGGLDISEWYRFVDMDGDGDHDLLAEEPFSYIRYYRNDGSPAEPRFVLAEDTLR